jgi:hypothetical protein
MKYLVSFLLLFCGLSAFSQADTIFVLGAEFGATTEPTDSTFTVDIIHPTDQLGQAFTASKIQVGYRLIDVFGRLYRVKSVDATGIGSSTLTVVELQNAAGPSGTGLVYRKPDNSDCIPEIQTGDIGISYALAARIANHNAVVGCGGTGGGDTPAIDTLDVFISGQSNIVGTDFTIGDWTYEIDSSVFAFQYDDATFEVATPSNITREVYTADRNNIGWAFAKAYRKTHPNTVVRIMVSADGGKSVTNWTPTVEASPYESNEMLDSIAQKLSRAPVDFLADVIIWHQGESDAIAASTPDNFQYLWAGRLMEVYDTLVGFPKISDTAPMLIGWVSYEFNTINAQIDSVNTGKYNLGGRPILATQKFGALNTVETGFTRTHYTNESIDIIGGLYANRLEGQSVETENLPQNWLRYGTWAKKYIGVDSHVFTGNTSGDSISRYQLDFGALGSVLRGYNATGANAFTLRSYVTAGIQQELASGGLSILTGDIVMASGGLNITGPYMRISNDGVNDFIDMLNGGSRSWIIRAYSSSGVQAELRQGALLMAGGGIRFTDNLYDIGALGATRPRTGYFGTSLYSPTVIGGNSVVQKLTFQTSSGSATTGSDIIFKDNDTEWVRILNNGNVGIGTSTPGTKLQVTGTVTATNFTGIQESDLPARPATDITISDTGGYFTGSEAEAVTQEIGLSLSTNVNQSNATQSGTGTPVGSVTPVFVGQHYIDTTTPGSEVIWFAVGLANTNWVQLN